MKLLFVIPHFYQAQEEDKYGSCGPNPEPRISALTEMVLALHQLFGTQHAIINFTAKCFEQTQPFLHTTVDVVICTTGEAHILDSLMLSKDKYRHYATQAEPMMLGFECHRVLAEHLGQYDYYCMLEDDLVLTDPLFFIKQQQFNARFGIEKILMPHRYELHTDALFCKAYIDGPTNPNLTKPYLKGPRDEVLQTKILGLPIEFGRPLNPHSGCFFLNAEQMAYWNKQPYFAKQETSFIGPLESAATLGVMKAFDLLKPLPNYASFCEILHHHRRFTWWQDQFPAKMFGQTS